MKASFYEFTQNNSGGSFDVDDKLCHRLFIEELSEGAAIAKAKDMGVYFDGCDSGIDCDCCGDRWYEPSQVVFPKKWSSKISFASIGEYAQHLADNYGWTSPDVRVFCLDGTVDEFFSARIPRT